VPEADAVLAEPPAQEDLSSRHDRREVEQPGLGITQDDVAFVHRPNLPAKGRQRVPVRRSRLTASVLPGRGADALPAREDLLARLADAAERGDQHGKEGGRLLDRVSLRLGRPRLVRRGLAVHLRRSPR
jgi:hypothetical protein